MNILFNVVKAILSLYLVFGCYVLYSTVPEEFHSFTFFEKLCICIVMMLIYPVGIIRGLKDYFNKEK